MATTKKLLKLVKARGAARVRWAALHRWVSLAARKVAGRQARERSIGKKPRQLAEEFEEVGCTKIVLWSMEIRKINDCTGHRLDELNAEADCRDHGEESGKIPVAEIS